MRQGVGNAISIMGSRPTSNNFMIDGTANVDTALGTPAAILSVDAIEEFKEQTTTYSAEYRLQRQPDQPGEQVGHQHLPRHRLRLHARRSLRRSQLLRPGRRREAAAGSEAVRRRHRRAGVAQPDLLPVQLRRDAHQARLQFVLYRAQPGEPRRPVLDDDHRPAHRPAVPEQHHPDVAVLAAGAAGVAEQLVSDAEQHRGARQLSAGPHAAAGSGPVHDPCRSHARPLRSGLRPLHQHHLRQPHQLEPARDRRSRVRAGHEELAGVAHVGAEVEPGEPIPGRPGRGARRSERHRVLAGRCRLPAADGRVHRPARHPARVSGDRHPGLRRRRRRHQRLLGQQPADVGHQQHHDLRGRPSQPELRAQLSQLAAAA